MALTPVHELQHLIQQTIAQNPLHLTVETIDITQAVGRILAQNVVSSIAIPYANVSAMDGYALSDAASANSCWTLIGESSAGHRFDGKMTAQSAIRIMTGAVVPDDAKTVVMQENVVIENQQIIVQQESKVGNNIRFAGEEIASGDSVLSSGRILRDADILLLASLGWAQVQVFRKIRVAVLSTGDELCELGQALNNPAQIYDSNRPMLIARLQNLPIEVIDGQRIPDDLNAVKQALTQAHQHADVVITSGGVSVGDYDYLREAVNEIGTIHHYKVAMKPGKPFVFGQLHQAWYFGLPGNPISGFVGFDMFIQSALWQLAGASDVRLPLRFFATLTAPVKKSVGRMDIQRAVLSKQTDGNWTVAPCGSQDSHRVLGISQANAYMILPLESGHLASGEQVEVQPFTQAFL